ncbi:hypothetical protein [Nonomuraea sp. bgisy101]|uniref:hypothetical protein n=1 Tax=Nonomuraea sp. bgisy101 TaxID=3413784 RepID=UPI003D718623
MGSFDGMDPTLVRDLLAEVQRAAAQMRTIESRVAQAARTAGLATPATHRPSQVADACESMARDVTGRLALLEKKETAPRTGEQVKDVSANGTPASGKDEDPSPKETTGRDATGKETSGKEASGKEPAGKDTTPKDSTATDSTPRDPRETPREPRDEAKEPRETPRETRDEAKEPRDVPKEQREVPKEQRDDDRASRTTNPRDTTPSEPEPKKHATPAEPTPRSETPRDTTPADPPSRNDHPKTEADQPRSETDRPRGENPQPSRETDQPKTETGQPRSETDRPRGENPQPSRETDQPRSETGRPSGETDRSRADEAGQPSRETEQPKTGTDEPKDDERDSRRDRGTEPDRSGQDILDTPGKDHPDDIDQTDAGKPQVVEVDGVKVLQIPLDPPTAREVEDLLEHADAVQPVDLPSVERAVDPAAPADLPSVERAVDPPAPAQPSDGAAGRTGSQTGTGEVPATWANDGSDVVSADARPPSDAAVKSLADHASDIGPKDMPGVRLPTGEWGRAAIPDGIGPDGPAGSVHPGEAAAQAQDTDGRASAGTPDGDAQVSKGGRDGDPQVSGGGRDGDPQVSGGGRDGDPQVSGGGCDGDPQVSGGGRDGDAQTSGGGRDGDPQVSRGGCDGDPQVSGGGRDSDPQVSGRVADGHAQVADGGAASSRVPEGMPDGHEQEAGRTPDADSPGAGGVRESPAAFGGVGGTGGEAATGTGPGDVARWANDGSDVVSVDAGPPSEAALRTLMDDASDIEPMDMPSVRVPPGEWGRGEWVPENIRPDGPAGSVDPGGPTARPADADGRTPGDAPDANEQTSGGAGDANEQTSGGAGDANEQTSGGAGDADRRDTDRASDGYVRDPGGVAGGVRESPAAFGGVGGTGGEAVTGTGPGDVARWANDGSDVVSVDAGPPSEAALRTLMDDASDIEPMDMPSVRVPPGEWGKGEWVPEDFGPDGAPGRVEANAPDRPIVPPGS